MNFSVLPLAPAYPSAFSARCMQEVVGEPQHEGDNSFPCCVAFWSSVSILFSCGGCFSLSWDYNKLASCECFSKSQRYLSLRGVSLHPLPCGASVP